ncbi:hypothetical protein HK413_00955 [Mucilaginibacter sp. S1162]|uniref:Uncharacterized protein n=1 Tax=Mucilaginibacter humi TaxID=2732510 RepID=A0ABX1VYR1_9SPHI|nr:hypothetical protein [Mucilaginibacter humi]
MFDSVEYKKSGAIFWPDYWKTTPSNPIWKIVESRTILHLNKKVVRY